MYYIIFSVVVIIAVLLINKLTSKKRYQLLDSEFELYRQKINSLKDEQDNELLAYIEKIKQQKIKYDEEYNTYLLHIKEKEGLLQSNLAIQKKSVDEQLKTYSEFKRAQQDKDLEDRKQKLNNDFNLQSNKLKQDFIDAELQYKLQLLKIQEDIVDQSNKRDAIIKQWKEEEQKRENQSFYVIKLTENDKNDIKILRSIEDKFHNTDALNKLIYEVFIKKSLSDLLNRIVGITTYSGIYKITHIQSQKSYIGQSTDVKKRLTEHVKGAFNISTIADQEVHHAMAEYGIDQFTFEILEKVEKDKLNEREKYYIKLYQSQSWGWNKTGGGARN